MDSAFNEGAAPTRFRPHQSLGAGREFDLVRALMAQWGDLVADIGDDAAVLPSPRGQHLISTDACVEDVHFRRAWISPQEIGTRAAVAALSDLAAMGASAGQVLVALVLPPAWESDLLALADGLAGPIRAAGARIVGGNLSGGATFSITLTVIGDAPAPIPRSGARVGDVVVVTGVLGGPGAAIAAWQAGQEPDPWARRRFVAPVPRLLEGRLLSEFGVTAMLDVSDGLSADARHLGAASGVTLAIDPARLPCGPGLVPGEVLKSGEEYELLATMPAAAYAALASRWDSMTAVPLTAIGTVVPASERPTDGSGHDHFAPNKSTPPR
jgi:thiamine-monophosphate kinase